ncbi:MAG: DNA topoisomerase, partial [Candidatus Izemoplasmatales bacterium]|nr:DNA topoisomerase [Candidatus Izemoplasmatales bacterium]
MIYSRAVASIMKPSMSDVTTNLIENNESLFKVTSSKQTFDGYLKIYGSFEVNEEDDEVVQTMPLLKENQVLTAISVNKKQLFTKPPLRYSEARLIKEMEDLGIGRPSTYAQTILTLRNRRYVTFTEKKFFPTEQGLKTIENLDEFFSEFISANYSKDMENILDAIASGKAKGLAVLHSFYDYFMPLVENATLEMVKEKPKETGEICPQCGSKMVFRQGRFGEFEACSDYPTCKYIKQDESKAADKAYDTHVECPECHKGTLLERTAKKGKNKGNKFYGCSSYPKCKFVSPLKPSGRMCPDCGNVLVINEEGILRCIDDITCKYTEVSQE